MKVNTYNFDRAKECSNFVQIFGTEFLYYSAFPTSYLKVRFSVVVVEFSVRKETSVGFFQKLNSTLNLQLISTNHKDYTKSKEILFQFKFYVDGRKTSYKKNVKVGSEVKRLKNLALEHKTLCLLPFLHVNKVNTVNKKCEM